MDDQFQQLTPDTSSQNQIVRRGLRIRYIVLIGLLLFIVGLMYVFVGFGLDIDDSSKIPTQTNETTNVDSGNKIYITAAKKGSLYTDIYTINTNTSAVKPLIDEGGYVRYTSAVAPQNIGQTVFFSSAYATSSSHTFVYPLKITFLNNASGELTDYITPNMSLARLPQWSPDGKMIAYTGLRNHGNLNDSDDWVVVLYDVASTKSNVIGMGTQPVWSPDGTKVLFVRSDGVYVLPQTAERGDNAQMLLPIAPSGYPIKLKMSLSDDGNLIAISEPGNRRVTIYQIDWDSLTVTPKQEIETSSEDTMPFWPVFSPDMKHIAVLEAQYDKLTDSLSSPALWEYSLEGNEGKQIVDLSEYDPEFIFVTDWE